MRYQSTRNKNLDISAADAIIEGLSREGGLFLPREIPEMSQETIKEMAGMTYNERAAAVFSLYLDGYTAEEIENFVARAYNSETFAAPEVAPTKKLDDATYFLELWHGPTCAFKDVALQILPHLLTAAMKKNSVDREIVILVATSGDTGKAALEGFCDVPGTRILVFYPKDGVSDVQKLQMTTQRGKNTGVCAIDGNFDDAQTAVKKVFSDPAFNAEASEKGFLLSSANSINWGRLLPQIVYYFSSYLDLVNAGEINFGDKINFCVPTGNFGDILAGYYAKKMGLPVNKLICASNINNVLTDFIDTGVYNKNREFHMTSSPSMDILVSSNLERLIFELSDKDDALVSKYMVDLSSAGTFKIGDCALSQLQETFASGYCDEEETARQINKSFFEHSYLIDTHTAVASCVLEKYRSRTGDMTKCVVLSTASPFKFCDSVLGALNEKHDLSGVELIEKLSEFTRRPIPEPLKNLGDREERFTGSCAREDILEVVRDFLN